jgi:hypothetical protein
MAETDALTPGTTAAACAFDQAGELIAVAAAEWPHLD